MDTTSLRRRWLLTAVVGALDLASPTGASALTGPPEAGHTHPGGAPGPARAASPATAGGSIAFIRDHDVWLARGDGSGEYRVTRDGTAARPYTSPSQSDTGVIAVGHGKDIVRMTQNGTVLGRLDPPPLVGGPDTPPAYVAISPDGEHIAYTLAAHQCDLGEPGCRPSVATAITRADRLTPATTYGITPYWTPSWASNTRTLQTGGYLYQVMVKDLGGEPMHWFDDHELPEVEPGFSSDLGDAELSADGQWLAAVRGYGDSTRITWYRVDGDPRTGTPPGPPDWLCATSELDGLAGPTWAPDSRTFAWQEPDGIWSTKVTGEDCRNPGLLIADASEPDWSAADLAPAPRRFQLTRPAAVTGKPRVGTVLRAGDAAFSPTPTSVRRQWLRSGKVITGATKATYRLTGRDLGKRISVRITARADGYRAKTVTSKPTAAVRR